MCRESVAKAYSALTGLGCCVWVAMFPGAMPQANLLRPYRAGDWEGAVFPGRCLGLIYFALAGLKLW